MKTPLLIILFVLGFKITVGQSVTQNQLISRVNVDKNFIDTLSFDSKWQYPWYIIRDGEGNFENTICDTIYKTDTIHRYYTANCITNHQGKHNVNYCEAYLLNDTIQLIFMPELPAYASSLTIQMKNNNFWSNFYVVYPMRTKGEKLFWTIKKQKLILNEVNYEVGDIMKGYVEIDFVETNISPNKINTNRKFYFKGYFKTQLNKKD